MSDKVNISNSDGQELTCSIIGSFRKHYSEVASLIGDLENSNVQVLSPKRSSIIDPDEWFVRLQTDNPQDGPVEIELIALERILGSRFVYVFCPEGYVGKTTCYEIGLIRERKIPLYFSEHPKDLPIAVAPSAVIEREMFVQYLKHSKCLPAIDEAEIPEHVRELQSRVQRSKFSELSLEPVS